MRDQNKRVFRAKIANRARLVEHEEGIGCLLDQHTESLLALAQCLFSLLALRNVPGDVVAQRLPPPLHSAAADLDIDGRAIFATMAGLKQRAARVESADAFQELFPCPLTVPIPNMEILYFLM